MTSSQLQNLSDPQLFYDGAASSQGSLAETQTLVDSWISFIEGHWSPQSNPISVLISCLAQLRKPGPRELEKFAKGHTAHELCNGTGFPPQGS